MAMPKQLARYWAGRRKRGSKNRSKGVSMARARSRVVYSRRGFRRRSGVRVPVAVLLGFMPLVGKAIGDVQAGGIQGLRNTVSAIIPYDPATRKFTMANLGLGLWPIIGGLIVHKVAGMLGVNRAIASMGIPVFRV